MFGYKLPIIAKHINSNLKTWTNPCFSIRIPSDELVWWSITTLEYSTNLDANLRKTLLTIQKSCVIALVGLVKIQQTFSLEILVFNSMSHLTRHEIKMF